MDQELSSAKAWVWERINLSLHSARVLLDGLGLLLLFWYLHGWIFPTGANRYMYGWSKIVHRGTWMGLTSYTVVHGWVTFPSKLVHGWVMGGGTSKFPEAHPYPDQSWVPPRDCSPKISQVLRILKPVTHRLPLNFMQDMFIFRMKWHSKMSRCSTSHYILVPHIEFDRIYWQVGLLGRHVINY